MEGRDRDSAVLGRLIQPMEGPRPLLEEGTGPGTTRSPWPPQAHKPVSFVSSTMSAEEDAKWLQWVTHQFETIAGEDREINLQEFKTALNVKEASVRSRSRAPRS